MADSSVFRGWMCGILAACALLTVTPAAEEVEILARQFDYDPAADLMLEDRVLFERDGAVVHEVAYTSPRGGRVPAFLVVPARPSRDRRAAILFGHWGPGTRTEFLPEAILYARAGAVSLLVDYPWVRPTPSRRNLGFLASPEADREAYIQAVIDLRRGLDLLELLPDVDPGRLAYVGHSYGAQWGAVLSAVEPRLKTCVLVGGTPDAAAIWLESDDPEIAGYREQVGIEGIQRYVAVMDPLDAIQYVPHARVPLFFQFARFERYFSEAAMNRYAAAAREPKTVAWYDTGHDLNDPKALMDRAGWLRRHVGIRKIALRDHGL